MGAFKIKLNAFTRNFSALPAGHLAQVTGTGLALPLIATIFMKQNPRAKLPLMADLGNIVSATATGTLKAAFALLVFTGITRVLQTRATRRDTL